MLRSEVAEFMNDQIIVFFFKLSQWPRSSNEIINTKYAHCGQYHINIFSAIDKYHLGFGFVLPELKWLSSSSVVVQTFCYSKCWSWHLLSCQLVMSQKLHSAQHTISSGLSTSDDLFNRAHLTNQYPDLEEPYSHVIGKACASCMCAHAPDCGK